MSSSIKQTDNTCLSSQTDTSASRSKAPVRYTAYKSIYLKKKPVLLIDMYHIACEKSAKLSNDNGLAQSILHNKIVIKLNKLLSQYPINADFNLICDQKQTRRHSY
jgi:hypothetical protein